MKLYINKMTGIRPDQVDLISQFCVFCSKELGIENPYIIHVVDEKERYGITTTAVYNVGNNKCTVYGKNRAIVDICRSIAHEMTHMMQDEQGLITGYVQDAGGFHEDQANARAGELIKRFAKSSKERRAIYESRKKRRLL